MRGNYGDEVRYESSGTSPMLYEAVVSHLERLFSDIGVSLTISSFEPVLFG